MEKTLLLEARSRGGAKSIKVYRFKYKDGEVDYGYFAPQDRMGQSYQLSEVAVEVAQLLMGDWVGKNYTLEGQLKDIVEDLISTAKGADKL